MPRNPSFLKVGGVLLVVLAIVYALAGTLILIGKANNLLPEYNSEENIIIIISYVIGAIALIGAISCFAKKLVLAKIIGILFAIFGLTSLISLQITEGEFNIVSCIIMVIGVLVYTSALKQK